MSKHDTRNIIRAVKVPIYLVGLFWFIHILKLSLNWDLDQYGVLAREISGISGIFISPLIHGSFEHLLSNSVPFLILCFLIFLVYPRIAYQSLLLIYVLTGLAVWSFARGNVIHIGASGVIYGMVSFVFWMGIFRRNVKSIILALIVSFLYSGYFLGVLPNQRGISWESHLFGGFVGILVAFILKDTIEKDKVVEWDDETQNNFLDADTFTKTKFERSMEHRNFEGSTQWTSDHS